MNGYEYYGKELLSELFSILGGNIVAEHITRLNGLSASTVGADIVSKNPDFQSYVTSELKSITGYKEYSESLRRIEKSGANYLDGIIDDIKSSSPKPVSTPNVDIYVLILSRDIKDIPLFINSHRRTISALAKWRLEIGK